jgi:type II secretory pathway component GspD/PulD (secretin)
MKRILCLIALAVIMVPALPAQQIKEIEFKNQAITDILLALGGMAGRSIVPDETVQGNASYYFTETDFETALKIFLTTYKMYFWKEGNIYYVSRVRTLFNKDAGTATVDAEDVDITLIVRSLSRTVGKTILFDPLPRETLTVHVADTPPDKILGILLKRFTDYSVETNADFFYIRRAAPAPAAAPGSTVAGTPLIRASAGVYSLDTDRARLRDILVDLFRQANVEYSLFLRSDTIVENLHFSSKKFQDMLRLVLEQASADYTVENGIYYVYDVQRSDILKKLKTVRPLVLQYLSVDDLPNLLPPDLAAQNLYRLDRPANTVILTGSSQEIDPIDEFIRALDRPQGDKRYYRFDLNYLKVSDFLALLPPGLNGIKPIALPQGSSFVMLLSADGKKSLDDYLPLIDRKQPAFPVQLRYIQSDTLVKNLPPSVSKDDILQTADSTLVFFTGTEDKRRQFLRELDLLDRPAPQIRYELLVVQYQDGNGIDFSLDTNANPLGASPQGAFLGSIGKLLNLNFNIVSTFGYLFAVQLNLSLSANKASVLADTSLNGLSGQDIKFQNTETSRYQQIEVDPDTGKQLPSAVTREITTGLIITMNGWVSGDGMITMKVTSTVSKQGTSTSTTTGSLPNTSEKVVSTNVRTQSGKPVVIGGLIQQDKDSVTSKIPILGDIPLLGEIFTQRTDSVTNTELVIYIVPHVEHPQATKADEDRQMESIYDAFIKDSQGG